mmetsp:Transcript_2353/g.5848  ORF Transcript_2353/g.5848 Transcript_2353/m.5848 type:complete len:104 (-) Transcript_2353:478-789(-)
MILYSLQYVEIAATAQSIGIHAFCHCTSLVQVFAPLKTAPLSSSPNLKTIGMSAFAVPASLRVIGRSAFDSCPAPPRTTTSSVEHGTWNLQTKGSESFHDCKN